MADLTYSATLDDKISPALRKIEDNVNKVTSSFSTFRTVLGALAVGSMVTQVLQFSDAITDTADAFGATTAEVLALTAALGAAGGKGDNAIKIFQGVANSIDDLNQGNVKTLQTFEQLGFSLSELGRMSESEIRNKLITQLAEMKDKTEASALAMKLFGKAAIGVDFAKLADEIKNSKEESEKYAGAIKDAGDAMDSLEKITKQMKLAFAEAFNPLFQLIKNIKVDTDSLTSTFKVLSVAIVSIATGIIAVRIATVAATTAMAVFNAVSSANPWILGAKVIIAGLTAVGIMTAANTTEQTKSNAETAKNADLTVKNVVQTTELNNKIRQQREELSKIGKEYQTGTYALKAQLDLLLSTQRISALDYQVNKAANDLQLKFTSDLKAAKEQFNKLDSDSQKRQLQAYLDNVRVINQQYDIQQQLTSEIIRNEELIRTQTRSQLEFSNVAVDSLKTMAKMRAESMALTETAKERIGTEASIKTFLESVNILQKEINNSAMLTTAEKKKYLDQLSRIQTTEDAIAIAQELQYKTNSNITAQILAQNNAFAAQAELTAKLAENARSFSAGWAQAFNQYAENGTNAARIAGDMFNATTRNMESAIDRFVETGKFSFGDFARSVIQDLIKIELKAQATKLLTSIGGGGGIFGAIGSLLGFADGGSPPVNKPSIVGEKGPELFVPRTAGTVIPNGAGMGPQNVTNNYITNQISAIDSKSVAQLFAENRKTLLGTVQLAQKELPYGNR
jgi:lambda family phage tail tape measure protein